MTGLFFIALGLLAVDAESVCPRPAVLAGRLAALSPGAEQVPVRIIRRPDAFDLEIGEGAMMVRRTLPLLADCGKQEELLATVIAAWHSQLKASLGALPPAPVAVVRAPPASRGLDAEGEVAFVAALAGASFAPAAAAELRLTVRGWRPGFRIGFLGESTRELNLSTGRASWGRSALTAGADYLWSKGRLRVDLRAFAALALLYVSGAGFEQTYQRFDVDVGLGGGLRVGVRAGPVEPFLAIDVVGWLRPEDAVAQQGGVTFTASIPRFEVLPAIGLAFGRAGPSR